MAALSGEEEGRPGGAGVSVLAKPTSPPPAGAAAGAAAAGLLVLMEVQLHVSSGLRVKVTDLDIAVLQGIATSLIASLGGGQPAAAPGGPAAGAGGAAAGPGGGAKAGQQGTAGKSLTYALDKAQRRMVASLRQAFRLADVNKDGTLDRAEVEGKTWRWW